MKNSVSLTLYTRCSLHWDLLTQSTQDSGRAYLEYNVLRILLKQYSGANGDYFFSRFYSILNRAGTWKTRGATIAAILHPYLHHSMKEILTQFTTAQEKIDKQAVNKKPPETGHLLDTQPRK